MNPRGVLADTTRQRVSHADVAAVLDKYPSLSAYGMGHGEQTADNIGLDFNHARSYLLDAIDEVQCAIDWLRRHPEATGSSYRLKHDVEQDSPGRYVSNGALIVALILLDRPMRGSRNCVNPVVAKKRTGQQVIR
jgi:hypothetical protein